MENRSELEENQLEKIVGGISPYEIGNGAPKDEELKKDPMKINMPEKNIFGELMLGHF